MSGMQEFFVLFEGGVLHDLVHDVRMLILTSSFTSFCAKHFDVNLDRSRTEHLLLENVELYPCVKLMKSQIFKPKCSCRKKSMQETESIMT